MKAFNQSGMQLYLVMIGMYKAALMVASIGY